MDTDDSFFVKEYRKEALQYQGIGKTILEKYSRVRISKDTVILVRNV